MGLRRAFISWLLKASDAAGYHVFPWMHGKTYVPTTNYRALVKKYQSWVYACANLNAITCAQTPLRLYASKPASKSKALFPTRKLDVKTREYLSKSPSVYQYVSKGVDVEEVLAHPFLDLMNHVNDFMNRFDLLEGMFLSQELTGNAYWHLTLDNLGRPVEIWPLFPQFMRIIPDKEKFISSFEYNPTGVRKNLIEPELIVHYKYYNPNNAFYGYSPLEAAIVAVDLGMSMNIYETTLMQNRAQPDIALSLPAEAGVPRPEEQDRMRDEFKKRHGGFKKGGLAILTGGAELKNLGFSPKEMSFLKGREASLNEVAAVFGVPLSKITVKNVNRANAEAGEYAYMKGTVLPRLRKTEQKMNENLLPRYDQNLFVAFDNPVPEDEELRLKTMETNLKNSYTTINEEREHEGLEPVPWGDVPLVPMNVMPLGSASEAIEPPEGKQKHTAVPVTHKAPRRFPPLAHPTNFIDENFVRAMQEYFREQKTTILAAFDEDAEQLAKSVKSIKGVKLSGIGFTNKDPIADDFVAGWFDMQLWDKKLVEKTEPFVRATMMAGGDRAMRQLAIEREFDPLNPEVARGLEGRKGRLVRINAVTIGKVRNQLAAGLEAGETVVELRKRIADDVYDAAIANRAALVSRTETIWAWNEGAVQAYKQSGVIHKKIWVSSSDDRTCEFCPLMDGKVVDVEISYFGKGDTMTGQDGGELSFEYEEIGHPPLHPMCRCAIAPEVEEF